MTSAEVDSAVVANNKGTIEPQLPDSGNASVSGSPDCVRTNGEIAESDPTAQFKAAAAQDAVLTLTIQPTVGDSFEFQINSGEMVQELHQVLLERESTCHKTCFSLQLNGVSLDNFTEIRAIPDLVDGSVLHVVDEPYTLREARVHIRHVRDLLRHADQAEAASAVDMSSLSFLTSVNLQERGDKEKPFDGLPPEYVVPGTKVYPTLIKKRNERHMLDRLPTPYPVHSWLSPVQEVVEDSIRADDASQPHRVGFEDHLPGQIRDWNEELQTTHEMARATLSERVTRDRSVFKIHGDFIGAAIKGAMAVVDGNVMAINPADEPRTHMFIWNNIFFSLGFDVKDHYKELGGDAAAFAATSADLQGVRAYAALDNCKLCTLGMAIIDYRGYRVTAQSIIPGILDKEQEQSVVYGSVDFGKTVVSSEKYHELLEASAKDLKLLPHEVVIDDQGNTAKLFTSYETKVSEKAKALGFPRPFPHKLATLRQEIVEIFHEARCMQFIKTAANHVRQHIAANKENQEARMKLGFRRSAGVLETGPSSYMVPLAVTELVSRCAKHVLRQYMNTLPQVLETGPSSYMVPLAVTELVSRCAKHVLRQYMNTLPQEQLGCAIAHLLNAVFGNLSSDHATGGNAERNTKRNSRKNKKASASGEWLSVNTKEFWNAVCQEAKNYYAFDLKVDCVDAVVEQYGVQKISLLRRLCSTLGIQLVNKDYQLDSSVTRSRQPFSEDDIQNLIPVTKHRQPCATDAKKLFTRGQQAMQVGHLREAYECIAESVNLMTSVYGALHSELAQALRLLARLSYILGDPTEAVAQQHRAALMSERCNGIDHAYTIIEYINLAHFAFSNLYIPAALRLLYRARYLLLIAHGENHPLMAQIDGNIGVILFAVHEFDTALRFLQSAEAVMSANGEPKRLKSALVQHITARAHASRGDFRAALAAEKETYSIYNNLFGPEHDKTKESSEYLSQLTMQAVAFQRKVMDATKGNSVGPLLPAQLPQPSLSSILDVLNILNGIIIISVGSMPSANENAAETPESKPTTESLGMTDEALD
ncbi:tetratricopeptide repeat protein [Teladorsagia circumcincta]|uniref:Tetratricopeptide repeat protein n=1 Tax=Teladorsagia circumcincta TaxID=45464 RepID=A0A2G9UH11_TELCI|nr:tetratricopeptide repeat protein [Teladorsagia circumcincta]